MEGLMSLGAILVGFIARLGIPLLATAILIFFLRRMDIRWQREAAEALGVQETGSALFQQIRCWTSKECPQEGRERCPAFLKKQQPCWQVFRDEEGRLREECLDCPVFQKAPVPVSV